MEPSKKKDISILIGNALDHFDTALYTFLVPILSGFFFPQNDRVVSLILGYSVLITTFFTAPLGALIFCNLAKNYGPNNSLFYSLIGLSITTVIIGLLPTYESLGICSPILLIVVRILQGTFAGGEVAVSMLYIQEKKSRIKAIKASYYFQLSTMVGIICASAFAAIIYYLPENSKYWRLCFFAGGVTGLIGFILRSYKEKSEDVQNVVLTKKLFNFQALIRNRKLVFVISIISAFSYLTYYLPFVLMNTLAVEVSNVPEKTGAALNTILLILDAMLILLVGKVIVRFNAAKTLLFSCLTFFISIVPLIYFLKDASLVYTVLAKVWIILLGVIFLCPLNFWYKSLNIKEDEYLIIGIANSLGGSILGKATPAISLSIFYYTKSLLLMSVYFALIALLALIVIYHYYKVKKT